MMPNFSQLVGGPTCTARLTESSRLYTGKSGIRTRAQQKREVASAQRARRAPGSGSYAADPGVGV